MSPSARHRNRRLRIKIFSDIFQGRASKPGKELHWGTKAGEDCVGSWKPGAEVLA